MRDLHRRLNKLKQNKAFGNVAVSVLNPETGLYEVEFIKLKGVPNSTPEIIEDVQARCDILNDPNPPHRTLEDIEKAIGGD
jgi:predicted transcriptional regulator